MLSKDLTAATLRPAVLSILADGESYGYEIIKKAFKASDGQIEWAEGAIYPMLHRFERQGLIASRWKTAENGRRRKYYRLKPKGRESLASEKAQWKTAASLLNTLWGPEPCLT
ncbi:MAG: helix-turn-helix transcriptional regulator [Rhodothermales bacterium]|nr:helix-turn-helix transcriptional regulator [Rhodothermales bacterium]MBO6780827.1 helix-turn-helix transcriptional regulator [Rhodothermales bacterium]